MTIAVVWTWDTEKPMIAWLALAFPLLMETQRWLMHVKSCSGFVIVKLWGRPASPVCPTAKERGILEMSAVMSISRMRWLDIALFFSFLPLAELSEKGVTTSPLRTCCSYPWRCEINSLVCSMISRLHCLLMTSMPQWKARHGQIYVILPTDDLQSSEEHANPPHNSSPHKPPSVSWSVFISFWHFSALELQLHSQLCFYI